MSMPVVFSENRDFVRLYRRGRSSASPVLVVYCLPNRLPHNRIGITATKKVGGAVQRNRAKRLVRAAYRLLTPELPKGWDFVFVCRARTPHVKCGEVLAAMRRCIADGTAPRRRAAEAK